MRFSSSTTKQLKHYVYALVDPRDESIFYVGKASANNRAFDHLRSSKGEEEKQKKIREIWEAGHQPEVEILRYGLDSAMASFEVEAAVIDALGLENLTNKVRGHGIDHGRQKASEVERLHGSKAIAIERICDSYMLFFINQTYSPTKTEQELYDCTRQFWSRVSHTTRTHDPSSGALPYPVALAVVDSVVVRAYSVLAWFPAGSTFSSRRSDPSGTRWEFVGQLLEKHDLVGRRLTQGGKDMPANQMGYGYIN